MYTSIGFDSLQYNFIIVCPIKYKIRSATAVAAVVFYIFLYFVHGRSVTNPLLQRLRKFDARTQLLHPVRLLYHTYMSIIP